MTFTYQERLIIFANWLHDKSSTTDVVATRFNYMSNTKNINICSKCELKWDEWFANEDSLQQHLYIDCSLTQALKTSTSMKLKFDTQSKNDDLQAKNAYEERLIIFTKWSHTSFIFENLVVVEFCLKSNIKNFITCSECDLKLSNWRLKRNLMKAHKRQSSNCLLTRILNDIETTSAIAKMKSTKRSSSAKLEHESKIKSRIINENLLQEHLNQSDRSLNQVLSLNEKKTSTAISTIVLKDSSSISVNSTSTESASINCIAFSSQTSYLIIENLYHKQKTLLVKIEKELKTKILEIKIYLKELEMLDAKKIAEQVVVEAEKAAIVIQNTMKQKTVAVVIEAVKSETCVKNIDFFDFIMMINLSELQLSASSASFFQRLREQAVKYQKNSVLKALQTSLRDSALVWFKDQIKFTSLNNFKTTLTKTFLSLEIKFNSIIINSSSRFHICLECTTQFSSISRFLAHAQKSCNKIFTCKHCELVFNSNNKLHEHVRLHHDKKSYDNKTLRQRFVEEKNKHINLLVTSVFVTALTNSFVTFTRSMSASTESSNLSNSMTKKQVACSNTSSADSFNTSTNLIASTVSVALIICSELISDHKSLATFDSKILLMRSKFDYSITSSITFRSTTTISESSHHLIIMMKALVACSFTSSSISSHISIFSHQKSLFTSKTYMTVIDLFVMFEKMKKRFKKSLNIIHKRMNSSMSDQIKITSYFKSVDQSSSTSINSFKSSSLISCSRSTSRVFFSVNQIARTSQYQHIANDAISNLKIQRRFKVFKQEYIADADVIHINENIRVERFSTITKEVNVVKSSIKSADSSKIKWLKSNSLTSELCSTLRIYLSINQVARTSHITIDANLTYKLLIKSLKSSKSFKSVVFINSLNSTFRLCSSVNRTAKISQYQHIEIDQTSNLEDESKIKTQSLRQKYLVDADVIHINIDIRVETTLTKAKKYKLSKSIKSMIKSFKSIKLIKSLKSAVFVNSFCSTLRFSLSINHDLITSRILIAVSSLLQALRALIKQLADLSNLRVFVVLDIDISSSLIAFIDI